MAVGDEGGGAAKSAKERGGEIVGGRERGSPAERPRHPVALVDVGAEVGAENLKKPEIAAFMSLSSTWARAAEIRAGDFLEMATGVVVVDAVYASHGGRECVVRPARGGKVRALWFWPAQMVRIVTRSRGTDGPGEAIGPRPARGAVAQREGAGEAPRP